MTSFRELRGMPAGPHAFVSTIEIARAAEQVFPLLDPADPRYAKRQLGDSVAPIEGLGEGWRLILAAMPDTAFDLSIRERTPARAIAFECRATPQVGRLAFSHERYRLEPLAAGTCRLELINTVTFVAPLDGAQWDIEKLLLTMAGHNALARIRLHAESGLDAVRAASDQLLVGLEWECDFSTETGRGRA